MKPSGTKKIEFSPSSEAASREREIQLLFNIIEPDPEYQPIFTSDEATLLDSSGHESEVIQSRLEAYLKFDCSHLLNLPVWKVVDEIRSRIPGWPEEQGRLEH